MSELSYRFSSVTNLFRRRRQLEMITAGKVFAIYREVRHTFALSRDEVLERLALGAGMNPNRTDDTELLLDDGESQVHITAWSKGKLTVCLFRVWTASKPMFEAVIDRLMSSCGLPPVFNVSFRVVWHFTTARGPTAVELEEVVAEYLVDEAYPSIAGGVEGFIARYLESKETILVLQGPPGTGKTRLIRQILALIAARKGETAQVLYTGDQQVLETDDFFVSFMAGRHDAMVLEDSDHFLKSRTDGNHHLHRVLSVGDGLIQSKGRKIIFSTNLPNIGDLDEALVRPGRCFACLTLPELTPDEVGRLLVKLEPDQVVREGALTLALARRRRSVSLASAYSSLAAARAKGTNATLPAHAAVVASIDGTQSELLAA